MNFTFHASWIEALSSMPAQVRLEVYDAITLYGCTGTLPNLKALSKLAFMFMKAQIDEERNALNNKQEATSELSRKRAEAGRKGAKARKQNKQNLANLANEANLANDSKTSKTKQIWQNKQLPHLPNLPHFATTTASRTREEEDIYNPSNAGRNNIITTGSSVEDKENCILTDAVKEREEPGNIKTTAEAQSEHSTDTELSGRARASEEPARAPVLVTPSATDIDPEAFVAYFNEQITAPGCILPRARGCTERRAAAIRARASEYGREAMSEMVQHAVRSAFLNGGGNSAFRASLDWLLRPNNFVKVLEGNYDNIPKSASNETRQNPSGSAAPAVSSAALSAMQRVLSEAGNGNL